MRPGARRLTFWLGVGAVSILANFAIELAADKFPQIGLLRFVSYTHRGAGNPGA